MSDMTDESGTEIMVPGQTPFEMPELQTGKPEVSMAPLIDVVFLLLIFFMVTTVFPENRGFVIEKPASDNSEQLQLKKLVFVVDRQGDVQFKERAVTDDDITRLVREQVRAAPDTAVFLKVDRLTSTENLIRVMDACKSGGVERVGIATKPHDQNS